MRLASLFKARRDSPQPKNALIEHWQTTSRDMIKIDRVEQWIQGLLKSTARPDQGRQVKYLTDHLFSLNLNQTIWMTTTNHLQMLRAISICQLTRAWMSTRSSCCQATSVVRLRRALGLTSGSLYSTPRETLQPPRPFGHMQALIDPQQF